MKKLLFCPKCKENKALAHFVYQVYLDRNIGEKCMVKDCDGIYEEVNFPYDDMRFLIVNVSKDIDFLEAMIDLKQKDPIEYQSRMAQFKAQTRDREKEKKERWAAEKLPKCSYCGSTNIQVVRKNWSFMRGFATNATERVCANCGRKM